MKQNANYSNKFAEFGRWLVSKKTSIHISGAIEALYLISYYMNEKLKYDKSLAEVKDQPEIKSLCRELFNKSGFRNANRNKKNLYIATLVLYGEYLNYIYGSIEDSFSTQNIKYNKEALIFELFFEDKYIRFLTALVDNNLYRLCDLEGLNLFAFFNNNKISRGLNRFLLLRDVSNRLGMFFSNLTEENETLGQIDTVKEKPKEKGHAITSILGTHFNNGIRIDSPIELKRFRKFSLEYFGREYPLSDEKLKDEIMKSGLIFEGKVYSLSENTKDSLRKTAISAFQNGCGIIFYTPFFDNHESWLVNEGVLSAEMLKVVLKSVCSDYIYKRSYFTNNPNITIDKELVKCFEQNIILSYEQLVEMLQYIPLATIKWTLSQNPDFVWNSVGSYTHMSRFEITEKEKQSIINYAEEQTKRKGYYSLANLPLMDIAERNYELSVAAIHNAVFRICFDGKYERRGKIVTRKGIELNAFKITKQYCRTLDRCSLEELLAFEKELTGEIHHWISIGAAYAEMVRIDATTFVSKNKLKFDVDAIDAVLEDFCPGDYIPLLSVTTFAAFPNVRQPWTHFLLESYVRLFSDKYRFEVLSVNSRNCGAIVLKSCELDYPAIMTDAVAKSNVELNKREALEFLCANGYIGKRSWSGVDTLIKKAKILRERRH